MTPYYKITTIAKYLKSRGAAFETIKRPNKSNCSANLLSLSHCASSSNDRETEDEFERCVLLLQSIADTSSLYQGKQIHARFVKYGYPFKRIFMSNNLMNMYLKCGELKNARHVFDEMPERNIVSWTTMIGGYAQSRCDIQALDLFSVMHLQGIKANNFTLASVFRASAQSKRLEEAEQFHAIAAKTGFVDDVFVGSSIVDLYAKCENPVGARRFFDGMTQRNTVSWTSVITGYVHNGQGMEALNLFCKMQKEGFKSDAYIFSVVAGACAELGLLKEGKQVHAFVVKRGLGFDHSVRNVLIDMYAKCGNVGYARCAFDEIITKNVVSWTTMITGYAQTSNFDDALKLFKDMLGSGEKPSQFTYTSVISASSDVLALREGKQFHAQAFKRGMMGDNYVQNVLVDLYAKCQNFEEAKCVFDEIKEKTLVSYNTFIAGYAQHGLTERALELFMGIQQVGMVPNHSTFVSILRACATAMAQAQARQVHALVIKLELSSNTAVGSALVDVYSKCGNLVDANNHFQRMCERDTVSWNAMIAGCAMNDQGEAAIRSYCEMLIRGLRPNHFTFLSLLSACADLAAFEQGAQIHNQLYKTGFGMDSFVANAIIDMYAKCGVVEDACRMFDTIFHKDLVCWNAMISRYAQHGYGKDALKLFAQMLEVGIAPNHITFVSLLSACSHAGLVEEGWHHFKSMKTSYRIEPRIEHYSCMVDLLGRAGQLKEAKDLIEGMPFEPGAIVWRTLLGACRLHGNIDLGRYSAERVFELEPNDAGSYILLFNIYASFGMQKEAAEVRRLMHERGVRKETGRSWIEIHGKIHTFVVGDTSHPQSEAIYAKLGSLIEKMKLEGYIQGFNSVMHEMEGEEKQYNASHHSEKLAIAFGLLNATDGTCIRIMKNLRVCDDCHNTFKFISKITARKIVLRDINRFHHFRDGCCSCRDYW